MYRSGNVLFLILLAVALFAALSYAVTQSSRSGGNDISDEQLRLNQSRIENIASAIQAASLRLRIGKGCSTINYSIPEDWSGSDFSCHIYHPNGAGLSYQDVCADLPDCYGHGYIPTSIGTNTGTFAGGKRVTNGVTGYLFLGPYVNFPAGTYRLMVFGNLSVSSTTAVDVTSSSGNIQHAFFDLSNRQFSGDLLLDETVTIGSDVSDGEVRFHVPANAVGYAAGYFFIKISN